MSKAQEEILINSVEIKNCPHCNQNSFRKYGKTRNNIQRYFCNVCKKSFTPLTRTIFEDHKISISEWIELCLDILNYGSTSLISKVNKNAINTSSYWLHKLFIILTDYQNEIILKGTVYIDETFYSVIYSQRRRKDGKFLRGLSNDQFCIAIGCDKKSTIAILEGMGKPKLETTRNTFINHIQKKSTLIHDDEKSHKVLVKELELIDLSYNSKELKNLKDGDNPLNPINRKCDLLKKFLYSHSGFDRDETILTCFVSLLMDHIIN